MKINYITNSIVTNFDRIAKNVDLVARYQNDPRPTPDDVIWCKASVDFGKTTQHEIGGRYKKGSYRYVGNLSIQIKNNFGLGLGDLLAIADEIVLAFKTKKISLINFRVPRIVNVGRTEDDYQVNVICPFFVDSKYLQFFDCFGSLTSLSNVSGWLGFLIFVEGVTIEISGTVGIDIFGISGSLNVLTLLIALIAGTSGASGSLDSQPELGSSIVEISGASASLGSVEVLTLLVAPTAGISGASGSLNVATQLQSIITDILWANGDVTFKDWDIVWFSNASTVAVGTSIVSGNLIKIQTNQSSATGTSIVFGNLNIARKLESSIVETSDIFGLLDSQPKCIGFAVGVSGASGDLNIPAKLKGFVVGTSGAFGSLNVATKLQGFSDSSTSLSVILREVTIKLIGSIAGISNVSGFEGGTKLEGVVNAVSNVFLVEGSITWESPTSVSDPTSTWISEWDTIDVDYNTNAYRVFLNYGWGYRLEFTVSEVSCDKVRVLGYKNSDDIQVRGWYYDGSWHEVETINLPAAKAWIEFSLGGIQTITKFKFDFQTTNDGNTAYLYEVEYEKIIKQANLNILTQLQGNIVGISDVSGILNIVKLVGSFAGISSVSGSLNVNTKLKGSVSAESDVIGGLYEMAFTSRCRVGMTATQSVPSGEYTKLNLDDITPGYDNDSEWDTTNKRFVAAEAGYYHVSYQILITSLGVDKLVLGKIYKNGDPYSPTDWRNSNLVDSSISCVGSDDIYLEAEDFIEIFVYHSHGSNRDFTAQADNSQNYIAIHRFA